MSSRPLDVVAAAVALTGFAPVLAGAAVAIRLEDGGPLDDPGVRGDLKLIALSFAVNVVGKRRVRRWTTQGP